MQVALGYLGSQLSVSLWEREPLSRVPLSFLLQVPARVLALTSYDNDCDLYAERNPVLT